MPNHIDNDESERERGAQYERASILSDLHDYAESVQSRRFKDAIESVIYRIETRP